MKVMIVVTHLLGTGHLSRALTLAAAFRAAGHRAVVVSGGLPVPHLETAGAEIVQLLPVQSDGVAFRQLLTPEGAVADDTYLAKRQALLLETFRKEHPDAVITELFPFGRRILRAEFRLLLDAASVREPSPQIFASIRDILAPPSKPAKAQFAEELIAQYYDAVLVHSDPAITPLDLSWPVSEALADRLRYTGFVAPPPPDPHPEHAGAGEILVTAGGGDVGAALFGAAIGAAEAEPAHRWRLLVGGKENAAKVAALNAKAPANLIAEPARPDFRQMLHHARASVSMCGYNTALDLMQTRCPAVFVPFDDGSEVEQGIRATALAKGSGIEMIRSAELTPQTLLAALARAEAEGRAAPLPGLSDGAKRTVEIVESYVGGRDGG